MGIIGGLLGALFVTVNVKVRYAVLCYDYRYPEVYQLGIRLAAFTRSSSIPIFSCQNSVWRT